MTPDFSSGLGTGVLIAAVLYCIVGCAAALRFAAWARQTETRLEQLAARLAELEPRAHAAQCSVTIWPDEHGVVPWNGRYSRNGDL